MEVGDKVTWNSKHYYVMKKRLHLVATKVLCYVISKPNKNGSIPKVRLIDKTDIAFEHELTEGRL